MTENRESSGFPWRTLWGGLLILWGAQLIVERALGRGVSVVPFVAGVSALAWWWRHRGVWDHRRFWTFVVGAPLTGYGAAAVLDDLTSGHIAEGFGLLFAAAGWVAIYWVYRPARDRGFFDSDPALPKGTAWSLISNASGRPYVGRSALIIAAVHLAQALGQFGAVLGPLLPAPAFRYVLPVSVIALGGLIFAKGRMSRRAFWATAIGIAALFVYLSAAANAPETRKPAASGKSVVRTLPELEGRELFVEADVTLVRVRTGEPAVRVDLQSASRSGSANVAGIDVKTTETSVTVKTTGAHSGAVMGELDITVPETTAVHVKSPSADVQLDVVGSKVDVDTGSGDVRIAGSPTDVNVRTGSGNVELDMSSEATETGTVTIVAGSGSVRADVAGDPAVNVTAANGSISADGTAASGPTLTLPGTAGALNIQTGNGDVTITRRGTPGTTPAPA